MGQQMSFVARVALFVYELLSKLLEGRIEPIQYTSGYISWWMLVASSSIEKVQDQNIVSPHPYDSWKRRMLYSYSLLH